MKRLIDRHELRKALEDNICADCEKDPNNLRCGACLMDVAIEYIIAAPAIDAVEVVRCKDCYWWDRSWQLIETKPELRNCKKLRTITREDWFCAEGKRDEQDLP